MEFGRKRLPVGIEKFKELQKENFYYVDKTLFIKELLTGWAKVNLFTRPRRFGKSLNMSMLKSFFELGMDKELFQNLNIAKETELCEAYMGKFPVISVSLKGMNAGTMKRLLKCQCRSYAGRRESFSIFWIVTGLPLMIRMPLQRF